MVTYVSLLQVSSQPKILGFKKPEFLELRGIFKSVAWRGGGPGVGFALQPRVARLQPRVAELQPWVVETRVSYLLENRRQMAARSK